MSQLFFYYLYKIQEKLWRIMSIHSKVNGCCLVFHHITNKHINDWDNVQCTPANFKAIILSFLENGYSFVSIEEGLKLVHKKSTRKFVIVTFDDVPESVYINAYPIMKELNIPFTLFITTGLIDSNGYLTKNQILEMESDTLCTIGCHTLSHPMLRKCKDLKKELLLSKILLERIVNKPIRFMAYPYGRVNTVNKNSIKFVSRIYENAFSTVDCNLSDFTIRKEFFLPRIPITKPINI